MYELWDLIDYYGILGGGFLIRFCREGNRLSEAILIIMIVTN